MPWNDAQMEVQPFLSGGESLLWSGRPRTGVRLQAADLFMIPFSLMWGGFAIFWEMMVIRMHGSWFMKLWGVPFVAIGLFMIFGRFFVDAARRAGTYYAVTSNRVMIITQRGKTVASFPLEQIPGLTTTEGRDGFGNVVFVSGSPMVAQIGPLLATASRGSAPVLELIESPRLVAETITRAQREAAERKSA
jgi:hypothetical protein